MTQGYATIKILSTDFVVIEPAEIDISKIERTDSGYALRVPAGRSINDTLDVWSIKLTQAAIALVNGKTQDLSYSVQSNDEIVIVFQILGG